MTSTSPRVAIIGAGISGLSCADELRAHGISSVVFDKGRGPGGRMSTRYATWEGSTTTFDHGAQYFTVRSAEMSEAVARWLEDGVVSRWAGKIVSIGENGVEEPSRGTARFVGTPGMNAICQHLARGLDVRSSCRVAEIEGTRGVWRLKDERRELLGAFELVVSTAPPKQTDELLRPIAPEMAARVSSVSMDPCWALMMAVANPLDVDFDGAFINTGPLSWAARTSAKPGRSPNPERWVLHASPRWSEIHLEEEPSNVVADILAAFFDVLGRAPVDPAWSVAHRWRYALAKSPLEVGALLDARLGVGACGDWTNGNRVEGAWTSGRRLARMIVASLGDGA